MLSSGETRPARIFLVEDHTVVREGLASIIEDEADLQVCGEASSLADAYAKIAEASPDLVLLDLSLPDGSGLELIRTLAARTPPIPVLVLSMHDEKVHGPRALLAGARGYIMKHEATERVLEGIRAVLRGQRFISADVARRVDGGEGEAVRSPVHRLSDREFQVYQLIGQGLGPGEIAKRLGLSVKTVETHREHIKTKLGLANGRELVRHAMQFGMDHPGLTPAVPDKPAS
ncbi:MAG: response regulator [Tepidisphaerales bacterium]